MPVGTQTHTCTETYPTVLLMVKLPMWRKKRRNTRTAEICNNNAGPMPPCRVFGSKTMTSDCCGCCQSTVVGN